MSFVKKYQKAVLVSLTVTGLLFLWFNTSMIRFAKTLYLIATVSPFDRTIAGAPSILVLGDSTGYGTGAKTAADSIGGQIGKEFPKYSILNDTTNGRTIKELVSVVEKLDGDHELILLQIGGNDILQARDLATVERELRQIISVLETHSKNIVMMSSGNVGGARSFSGEKAAQYEQSSREFRAMFKQVAADTAMVYVDLFQEPADDPFVQNPDMYFAWDGLHPSSAGYALWYQSLSPVLKSSLRP